MSSSSSESKNFYNPLNTGAGLVFGSLVAYMAAHEYGRSFGGSVWVGFGGFLLGGLVPALGVIGPVAYVGWKTSPLSAAATTAAATAPA